MSKNLFTLFLVNRFCEFKNKHSVKPKHFKKCQNVKVKNKTTFYTFSGNSAGLKRKLCKQKQKEKKIREIDQI